MLYAWDHLPLADQLRGLASDEQRPTDLLIRVLCSLTENMLQRGLAGEYCQNEEQSNQPRGRIDLLRSSAPRLRSRRLLHSEASFLTFETESNRVIATTLRNVARTHLLAAELRRQCFGLTRRLFEVPSVSLEPNIFNRLLRKRHLREGYALAISICRLLHDTSFVRPGTGEVEFVDFLQDEIRMRVLFQSFVCNWLKRHVASRDLSVSARRVKWFGAGVEESGYELLPTLNTDVVVESSLRVLVIDTKYSYQALREHWGVERFREEHLFQIFAYCQNFAAYYPQREVEGMLLYPSMEEILDYSVTILGQSYRVSSLPLGADWGSIESRLLELTLPPLIGNGL